MINEINQLNNKTNQFSKNKISILSNIKDNVDKSFKGSIDKPIYELISLINQNSNYITTSSCSGRISIYIDENHSKGIDWLLVKHNQITINDINTIINNYLNNSFINLKCEPMIIHIECKSIEASRHLLALAVDNGCRESGITIGNKRIMVAIRTTSYSLELPLVICNQCVINNDSLQLVVNEINKRIAQNFCRIHRLMKSLKELWFYPIFKPVHNNFSIDITRWGHSSTQLTNSIDSCLIIGGYGEDFKESNQTITNSNSSRKIKPLNLTRIINTSTKSFDYTITTANINIETMHSASINITIDDLIITIVSGGRQSPNNPLPCILSAYVNNNGSYTPIEFCVSGDIPSNRWGHTLTHLNNTSQSVLIGGRDNNEIYNDIYISSYHINNNILSIHFNKLVIDATIKPLFFHASCSMELHYKDSEYDDVVIVHGGLVSLDQYIGSDLIYCIYPFRQIIEVVHCNGQSISRFGHTITNINYHTILLTNGTIIGPTNTLNHPSTVLLDIYPTYQPNISFYIQLHYSIRYINNLTNYPCEQCRCHHVSIYDKQESKLLLLGGGSLCLGFGSHYCQSTTWSIDLGANSDESLDHNIDCININDEPKDNYLNFKSEIKIDNHSSILIEKLLVKKIKTLLESLRHYDNKRRIVKLPLDATIDQSLFVPVYLTNDLSIDYNNYIDSLVDNNIDIYSIPITSTCYSSIVSLESSIIQQINDIINQPILLIYNNNKSVSKIKLSDTTTKAICYLQSVSASNHLSNDELTKIPSKYEIIGDILMIPEDSLNSNEWISILNDDIFKNLLAVFPLTTRVARKARVDKGPKRESHIKILFPNTYISPYDYLPKRLLKLISNPSNDIDIKLLQSNSWTEIKENNIYYYIDITKVMFCSGNITERIRMSTIDVSNEVIIDLYCGIGYYSLPFLIYGKVKYIYCCEWNINSINSLHINIQMNQIKSNNYTVLYGDNQITTKNLPDTADRICLGLLPSSESGWSVACYCLKRSGGILHVHENILDTNINIFTDYCINKLKDLFKQYNKYMDIQCLHVERVKSYAPRVIHIVADLKCTPIEQIIL